MIFSISLIMTPVIEHTRFSLTIKEPCLMIQIVPAFSTKGCMVIIIIRTIHCRIIYSANLLIGNVVMHKDCIDMSGSYPVSPFYTQLLRLNTERLERMLQYYKSKLAPVLFDGLTDYQDLHCLLKRAKEIFSEDLTQERLDEICIIPINKSANKIN